MISPKRGHPETIPRTGTSMDIKALIDNAAETMVSKSALARELGVRPTRLYDWQSSRLPCPMEVQIKLCGIAGLDDSECMRHLREAAHAPSPKTRHGVAASIVLAALAFVGFAAAPGQSHANRLHAIDDNVYYVNQTGALASSAKRAHTDRSRYTRSPNRADVGTLSLRQFLLKSF